MSKRQRLAWFGAVVFVVVMGTGNLLIWIGESVDGTSWWAIDFMLVIDAAGRLLDGTPLYSDPKFLYPPLAAVVAVPLTWVDAFAASLGYAALKIGLALACVVVLTPGWARRDQALAGIGVVTCLPLLHDVFLGNANVLIVASMVPAVFGAPRRRDGVILGLVAATFAKPLVVPVLLWLAVWRWRTFQGAVVAGLLATGMAVAVAGPGAYQAWIEALAAGSRYASVFAGNHGVTALVPELWAPVAALVAMGLVVVVWRRGPRVGLAWAATSGVLLAPYAGTYAALPIVLALPAIGPLAPGLALAIVATSPIATTHLLPLYAGAILVGALILREPIVRARSKSPVGLWTERQPG